MPHTVHCAKLGIEAEGLDSAPFRTPLGERIYQNISARAWDLWLSHQTMLINEYKLSLIEKQARDFLYQEMEKFLFGGGAEKPPNFTEN